METYTGTACGGARALSTTYRARLAQIRIIVESDSAVTQTFVAQEKESAGLYLRL